MIATSFVYKILSKIKSSPSPFFPVGLVERLLNHAVYYAMDYVGISDSIYYEYNLNRGVGKLYIIIDFSHIAFMSEKDSDDEYNKSAWGYHGGTKIIHNPKYPFRRVTISTKHKLKMDVLVSSYVINDFA